MATDIMMALALSGVLVSIIASASSGSRSLFEDAKIKERLIERYENGESDHEEIKQFGNERSEKISTLKDGDIEVSFSTVFANDLEGEIDGAGSSICSANIGGNIVGSYKYLKNSGIMGEFNPEDIVISPIVLPIDPLLPLTDLTVRNNIAYVTADSAKASDPDVLIANLSDPENATIISQLNTGPGLAGLTVVRDKIYAVATSRVSQLHIIDANDLADIHIDSVYKLPLPYATATAPVGSSIFYDNGYIFLGTEKWDGSEFNILDTGQDDIHYLGSLEIGSKVGDIFAHDGFAYVTASDEFVVRVIDISEPNNPIIIKTYTASGHERQEGTDISIFEDSIALARTSGGFNITKDHEVLIWGTGTDPVSMDVLGGVYGLVLDRSHIFTAERYLDKEFSIYSREDNDGVRLSFPLPVSPMSLTCDNDRLYVLAGSAPVIYEIILNNYE